MHIDSFDEIELSGGVKVSLDDLMPIIRERLAAGQDIEFFPHGSSMLPMIRDGRDSVILTAVKSRLKKYDIPLYRREDGKYILHRIIAVGDTYTCLGDNLFWVERGITDDQIIAVVSAIKREGREISVNSPFYRVKSVVRVKTYKIRCFAFRAKRKAKRIISKIISDLKRD